MSTPPPPPPPGYNEPQYGTPPAPPTYGAPGAPPPGYQPYPNQGFANAGYGGGQRQFAGVGARFGAMLLDGLIALLFAIPAIVAIFVVPREYTDCTIDGESGVCKTPTAGGWAIVAALAVIGAIVFLVLYCKKVGAGQSWGQKACGVAVIDKDSGQPIGTGRAVGRYFARIISAAPCYLGFFWAIWDKEKQTFHDKIVNTVVVKV